MCCLCVREAVNTLHSGTRKQINDVAYVRIIRFFHRFCPNMIDLMLNAQQHLLLDLMLVQAPHILVSQTQWMLLVFVPYTRRRPDDDDVCEPLRS